ncbi:hypothetical protein ACOME3_007680 [Neoechinorhynchus agilis]
MHEGPVVSIIVPTFNERQNLPILVYLIERELGNKHKITYEVIVVDDASPDATCQVANDLIEKFIGSRLVLVSRPSKLGLGTAYRCGLEHAKGDFIVLMDADLSHHPKYIPKFLEKQKETECDIVSGTRYDFGGGVCGWNLGRKLISRTANYVTQMILDPGQSDLTGSFRLYKREKLKKILSSCRSKGFVFQMEVIVRAKSLGMSIEEVPIVFVDRIFGQSKMGSTEIVQFVQALFYLSNI